MSNLKKILALVLALVMSFSLMSVSSAAFKDAKDIDADYEEAIGVLTGLGVIKGYDNGNFNPKGSITRAEAAAIMYRIITGDVANKHVDIYAGYGKFADVAANNWAAGYIGYCANGEIIIGNNGNFAPQENVTGYQMLVMLLRALGYGQNNEFSGAGWDIRTASLAESLGLLQNVGVSHALLKQPATRELVCELVFSAMTKTAMVKHTLLQGYEEILYVEENNIWTAADDEVCDWTLGYETFRLVGTANSIDMWGRPARHWVVDNDSNPLNWTYGSGREVYTFAWEAAKVYTAPVDECDIAADLGVSSKAAIENIHVNGRSNIAFDTDHFGTDGVLTAKDTKNTVGEQGRLVEFYAMPDGSYRVVMIDTFFAIVRNVTEIRYDKNNHVIDYAELDLDVYTKDGTSKVTLYADEWNYEVDDTLLINAWTESDTDYSIPNSKVDVNYSDATWYEDEYTFIIGESEGFKGAQTDFSTDPVHIVNKVEYPDAFQFVLNVNTLDESNRMWYFDQYKNLIATLEIVDEYQYGTISDIAWTDSYSALVDGYALAKITFMDGSDKELKVASIDGYALEEAAGKDAAYAKPVVDENDEVVGYKYLVSSRQYNGAFKNVALYRIVENANGTVSLFTEMKLDAGAEIDKDTAKLGTNNGTQYYNGNSTMYLVWNGKTYETYTGLNNVPAYNNKNTFYAVDALDRDGNVVEYVFVIGGHLDADKVYTNYMSFMAFDDDKLVVRTKLSGGVQYFIVYGGYVNGQPNTDGITVIANSITEKFSDNAQVLALLDVTATGKLKGEDVLKMVPYTTDTGFVKKGAAIVDVDADYDKDTDYIYDTKSYVVYGGAMSGAWVEDGILYINGYAYDITDANFVTHDGRSFDRHYYLDSGYVYVDYTYNSALKDGMLALNVYVSDVEPAGMENVLVNGESVVIENGELTVPAASSSDAETSTGTKVTGYNYVTRAEVTVAWEVYVAYGETLDLSTLPACDYIEIETNFVALSCGETEVAVEHGTTATIEALLAKLGVELATDEYVALDGAKVELTATVTFNGDVALTIGKTAEEETEEDEVVEEI